MKKQKPQSFIPFYRPRKIDRDPFFRSVNAILNSLWFTNGGPHVRELENRIADAHQVEHCVAVCNATIALQMVLKALDLTGEVITTPFTFIATAHAIQWQGLTPVFCDIDPVTLTISPAAIRENITPLTSAILGVHIFGQPCLVDEIQAIAAERNLKVVYDAAHCFMTSYQGRPIGRFGDAEVLSFHATKIFQTFEGGAILTNDIELAQKLRLLKNFGFKGLDWVDYLGINAKMNEVSAAYGLSLLPYMGETIARLKAIHALYYRLLGDIKGISIFRQSEEVDGNNQYMPIFIDEGKFGVNRDMLWAYLWFRGVESRRYFYPGIHMAEPYVSLKPYLRKLLPETDRVTRSILCLPCFFSLTDTEVESIADILNEVNANPGTVRDWFASFIASDADPRLRMVHETILRELSASTR